MIPHILWQTWKTKTIPDAVTQQAESWKQYNPQLEIKLYDDKECSDFILEHFGTNVHRLYLSLPQPIMRADFWRVAVVYINGGYYSDLDLICNINLSNIIKPNVGCVFIEERQAISNFFFAAEPKHPVLKKTLDMLMQNALHVKDLTVQDFGMHPLHHCVGEYFGVIENTYMSSQRVCFLNAESLFAQNKLIHMVASENAGDDYHSWRDSEADMNYQRNLCDNMLFFTTFNKNGYDLYGKKWIDSFITIANYYNKVRAKIYYEGFVPDWEHSSIEWINYETAIPNHAKWKQQYLASSTHDGYVKIMTVRFSHKALVIQHALDHNADDYLIWLDGDCVFIPASYSHFPSKILGRNFLACQVEENYDLNHVESGILIFNGKHPDTKKFNKELKNNYRVENILSITQPYDGFLIYKSLMDSNLKYVNLNAEYGLGGIQSDPNKTFCHPEIKNKFIHNIGWTGKKQYSTWETIFKHDDVYKCMEKTLFGGRKDSKDKHAIAYNKLQNLKKLRLK